MTTSLKHLPALIAVAVASMWLATAGEAHAATGQITFGGCLATDPALGCAAVPFGSLDDTRAVAVSSDGRSVYATNAGDRDSIAHLRRGGAGGELAYAGCVNYDGSRGCDDLPGSGRPLDGATGVAVSRDGRSVYVVSAHSETLTQFARAEDGRLTYEGCFHDDGLHGCTDLNGSSKRFEAPQSVAVTPDGTGVYAVASRSSSVLHFFRDAATGRLTYGACLSNDGTNMHCLDVPGSDAPLTGAHTLAIGPDSRTVYIGSFAADSISRITRRGPDGSDLTWSDCLSTTGSGGCGDVPGESSADGAPLDGVNGLAVSPDGRSVYATGAIGDAVSHLSRAPGGELAWVGCFNNAGTQGCDDAIGPEPFGHPYGVAVSPDGASVYSTSADGDSVAHLFRDPSDGRLRWDGCLADGAGQGCEDLPGQPLNRPIGVVVSPGDESVYVAASAADAVTRLARELPPAPQPGPGAPDPGSPGGGPGPGGSSGGAPDPSPAVERFGPDTAVTLALAGKRVRPSGPVRVRVANANPFAVEGRLSAVTTSTSGARRRRISLKAAPLRLAPGARRTVALRLPATLRAQLRRSRALSLRLTAVVRDPAGTSRTVRARVRTR